MRQGHKRSTSRLVAAACAAALFVTACGSDGSSGETGGPVKLTMYYPVAVGGPLTDVVDKLIADFEAKHDGITVEAVYSGSYADTMTKVQTSARGQNAPDVAVLLSTELYTLLDDKLVVSFDELVGDGDADWLDSFYEPFLANGQDAEGTTWSIPFQRSTIVQYHNKELFAKAGLDPEAPPQTWDELTQMSQKIVDSKAAEFGIEIPTTQFAYWMLQALAVQNDTLVVNEEGTETNLDDPGTVEALEYWLGLGKARLAPSGTVEWASTPEDFLQGRTAMMWTTTGNLGNIRENAGFDFGVSMLPEKVRRGSPTGGGNFYVFESASDAEREAAVELVKWFTAPEQTAEWSIATGYVATTPEAWETDAMKAYVKEFPAATVARDQLDFAVPELATHDSGRIQQLVNDAVAAAIVGQQSPAEAMSGAQEQADGLLARYR